MKTPGDKKYWISLIAGILLGLLGCGSVPAEDWQYEELIAARGTRSEHFVGKLMFTGRVIPEALGHVVTPIGEFAYIDESARGFTAQTNWVRCRVEPDGSLTFGYYTGAARDLFRSIPERKSIAAQITSKTISKADLETGFYSGAFGARFASTPRNWFYSVRFACWVDPLKIDSFLAKHLNTSPPKVAIPGKGSHPPR
jgi:hypothetical protein